MTKGPRKIELILEEIIATLQKTLVPTVIVEGDDDVIVLRRLENIYADRILTVFPAGGRDMVLRLFQRRHTLPKNVKVAFVADKDIWVLSDIPREFVDDTIFFSDGYSLENDVFRDGKFFEIMELEEKEKFGEEIRRFTHWYANCVCRFMRGEEVQLKVHPDQILNPKTGAPSLTELEHDEEMRDVCARINADPTRLLRGKALMGILNAATKSQRQSGETSLKGAF